MYSEVIKKINEAKKIYITGHRNPDGDSIGSTFGLYFALKKYGKDVTPILGSHSSSFDFLEGIDSGLECVKENKYDLLICVDSSSKERLQITEEDFNKADTVIMIDHHQEDAPYGDINVIDSTRPAACELVFNLINELGVGFDKTIASYVYTGLMTDTGSFNYSSTKPSTMRAAATLLETGIDFTDICKRLNDTIKESKLFLIKKAIENMEVYFNGKVRYTFIDYKTISDLGVDDEDAEGMTNYLRMVEDTLIAVYVREKSTGELKVSMRSNGNVDIGKVAIMFGGGGHMRASGYTMNIDNSTYEEEKEKLLKVLESEI